MRHCLCFTSITEWVTSTTTLLTLLSFTSLLAFEISSPWKRF
uniref:Uncharacterized protein MANES_11G135700 n=1 Tax=Rhizophora mucronata TaxID=61149 RepID=A0A2P2QMY1_RHIMU